MTTRKMPLQLRGTFPGEGKANENGGIEKPVEHSQMPPITSDRRTLEGSRDQVGGSEVVR